MPLSSFKDYNLLEEVRTAHAERLLLYLDRYHHEVLVDLKKELFEAWSAEVQKLQKEHPITPEQQEDALLQNPKTTLSLQVIKEGERLSSPRDQDPREVAPSVKVPYLYGRDVRTLMSKRLIEVAHRVLDQLTHRWSEIFKYEEKGRVKPWFRVLEDRDELRFQLSHTLSGAEVYKTLYTVRTDFGKPGSRTRDFDRIYLASLV